MKILLVLSTSFILSNIAFSQIYVEDSIEKNNVSALITDKGVFFQDILNSLARYEIPKGTGLTSIFSSAFWFGGIDINNQLHLAAPRYGFGTDLWPGPISIGAAVPGVNPFAQTMWHVSKDEIVNHIANVGQVGYTMPSDIQFWPAHGDTTQGQSYYLAPFVDVNQNGIYDPANGDHPCIKGDDAIYTILNDKGGLHTESGGEPIGLELHFMFYQIESNDDLNNTTFIDLLVVNRGTILLSDFYVSTYEDFDVGYYLDDYIGSDSTRNMIFSYNADSYDEDDGGRPGYHDYPPAIGIMCLNDTMRKAMYLSGVNTPMDIYNIMKGCDGTGNPFQDSTGAIISYFCPGDPNDSLAVSEVTINNPPNDRRMIMSVKRDYFGFQDTMKLSYAVIFSQDSTASVDPNLASVTKLYQNADFTQNYYDTYLANECEYMVLGLKEEDITDPELKIYPNPSKGWVTIELPERLDVNEMVIHDVFGREVYRETDYNQNKHFVNIDEAPGVYILKIVTSTGQFTERIVIE